MDSLPTLRSSIFAAFKMSGLNLRVDATKYLIEILSEIQNETERKNWLNKIVSYVMKQPLSSSLLEKDSLQTFVKECSQQQNGEDEIEDIFHVIQAFDVPKFEYLPDKKKFIERSALNLPPLSLVGSATDKTLVYTDRYEIIRQRVLRHDLFAPSFTAGAETKFQVVTVDTLLASSTVLKKCLCLGMLTQLKEDKFYLEDPTGVVEICLANARFQTGLFVENGVVLVEGDYSEKILKATAVGLPPIESADLTRSYYGNANFFGGPLKACAKSVVRLQHVENKMDSAAIAFLSDVWLDDSKVIEKLKHLFAGFSDSPPFCFVFCGPFLSKFYGFNHNQVLKDCFKALAQIVQDFPTVANCQFVFIPFLHEPLLNNILPKPPLPLNILKAVESKMPNCHLATNPCRLQYCTQEIVIFREDVVEKFCRNCVRVPSNNAEIHKHFARTVMSQGHLAPLPLHVAPVYWSYDYALRLYPLPDLVVCADKYKPYIENSHGCIVTNPGSFARNKFSFNLYFPASKLIEESAIPSE